MLGRAEMEYGRAEAATGQAHACTTVAASALAADEQCGFEWFPVSCVARQWLGGVLGEWGGVWTRWQGSGRDGR